MNIITKTYTIIISLALIIVASGCHKLNTIEGNGSVVIETRHSVSFNKVENSGDFNVQIIPDSIFYIDIEAESNLIPYIKTTVHGNNLEISTRENLDNNFPIILKVHTPIIDGVLLTGSGLIYVDMVESDSFEAILAGSGKIHGDVKAKLFRSNISGSGEINFYLDVENVKSSISGSGRTIIAGQGLSGDYKISGSGSIKAYGIPIADCYAKISGSGNIYTTVSDVLDVDISGSGNLFYRGNPTINSSITGSGKIIGE